MKSIFRQYTFDDSFEQVFVSYDFLTEYQIALTFATDYDENDNPTNGKFRPTWDTTKVTPEAITNFKKRYPDVNIKVFICIGNRGTQRPFKPTDNNQWVTNATQSLTQFIKNKDYDLQVDGIDVFYEKIDVSPDDFVYCIQQLIGNLEEVKVVSEASISPSYALNSDYYTRLYKAVSQSINWVDYQFQNEVDYVHDPHTLKKLYKALIDVYPNTKFLAGYSAENEDWATLSPIVFFLAGMDLLNEPNSRAKAPGISIHYHNYYAQPSIKEENA